jgi:hypothetical protein
MAEKSSNDPDRGVAFRVVTLTHIDADSRCRYGARIDATPGCRQVQSAGIERRLKRAAAGYVFPAGHTIDRFRIQRFDISSAAPLRFLVIRREMAASPRHIDSAALSALVLITIQ